MFTFCTIERMSSMLSPVLIGRRAELGALVSALDRAAAGEGSALFLTGDPGIGKSRLATEISSHASARGFTVYRGRAVPSASPLPFGPLTEVLRAAGRTGTLDEAAGDSPYRPVLASLVPELHNPGQQHAEVNPLTAAEAILRVLGPAGSAGSLLILEDLHWADPETLATVDYITDNLAGRPILCLVTLRDDEPSAGLDMVRMIHARRSADLIKVPRLSEAEVEEMARACLGDDAVAAAAADRLLGDCDGLPFAVEEILAAAVASGELEHQLGGWQLKEGISTGIPASIVGSVRNRLAALGPQAAEIIAAAAVLGRQFDSTLLPAIAGASEPEVIAALTQARNVQLIEPDEHGHGWLRFRHNLTREAIISCLLPADLARCSAAAAAAIEAAHPGLPGAWCERTAQLYGAARLHARAALLLLEAGRRAVFQGALGSATQTLSAARSELRRMKSADPTLVAEIDEALVKAFAMTGDFHRLAPVADEAVATLEAAGTEPRRRARLLLMAAHTESEGDPAAAARHLAAARAIADRLGSPLTSTWVDTVAARCAIGTGDLDGAEELARRSLASAEAAGLAGWAADVAFESLEVIGRRERARDIAAARTAFERGAEIADREEFGIRRIRALHELGTIDMLQRGDPGRLSEASEQAHRAGAIAPAIAIDLELANIWCLGPDLARALSAARRCEQGARLINAPKIEAMALATQSLVCGIRADRKGARMAAMRAENALPGDPEVLAATWGQGRVAASLFGDDIPQALLESSTGICHAEQAPPQSAGLAWAFYALLQAVAGRDGHRALERARGAGAAIGWNQAWLAYAAAVLAGRAGSSAHATALADEGDQRLRPYAPWWNHLVRRLVVEDAIRDGWGTPAAWMREATREFDASGYRRLAKACRVVLRRSGERVPRTGRGKAQVPAQLRQLGVTSREMDVFVLAAQGLSNADIASRLYISAKTVETHIASLVAKTGRDGRRDLIANAGRLAWSLVVIHLSCRRDDLGPHTRYHHAAVPCRVGTARPRGGGRSWRIGGRWLTAGRLTAGRRS
jgi:DNA-binding CsgD family transcriptional regulator